MFSQLGPLFKTVFRKAEHADARLEIRREEKENPRKKQGEETEDDSSNALWEDTTAVSVNALRAFLIEFLKKNNAGDISVESENDAPETTTEIQIPDAPVPVSSVAARAVKAYTSMTAQTNYTPPPSQPPAINPNDANADLASLLAADEIRSIHRLIGELDDLAKTGIESLSIQMNGTFLESVSEAIRLQKSSL